MSPLLRYPARASCALAAYIALTLLPHRAATAAPASPIPLFGELRQEAPSTLVTVDLEKGDAEIYIGGSWKGELTASGGIALTELGAQAAEIESPLLFTQTVDLTLSATMFDRWFVEATFLDDYALNTYRAGYLGAEGETVQYVGVGNVGLDFPAFPYADISGGTPNSFGAYAAFGAGALTLHALIRYDAASREEKVYVGSSERTQTDVSPVQRLRGRTFVLPDAALDSSPTVYLEDSSKGTLSGSDGRKYRIAEASEAGSSATLGLTELSSSPSGRVAVAYQKGGIHGPWDSSLGAYGTNGSGTGFLGETQAVFDESGQSIDLASYPQPGGGSGKPATLTIGGTKALAVYEKGTFSPFETSNRYASAGQAGDSSARLVHSSTGGGVAGYELEESTGSSFSFETDEAGETTASTSGRYFVLTSALSADRRSATYRFPLASVDPAVYLPGASARNSDIAVRFTSYGSAGSYDIGTDVVAGSVIVTRGGIRDPLATFDPATGVVTLASPAGISEVIRVSYLKNSQDRRFGSLAAGIGAVYAPSETFSARSALALRWNVSGEAFTAPDESSPGTVALSSAAAWKNEDFAAELAGALAYEAPDTTGLYRAVGMEGNETSLGMTESAASAAYPPVEPLASSSDATGLFEGYEDIEAPAAANAGVLIYRDYRLTDVLGNSTLKPIDWTGASVESSKEGPYPVSVSELDGKTAYVAEFELGEGVGGNGAFALWAGFQMELGDEAEALERAGKIVVPYRYYGLSGNVPVRAYIQIGSLADEDGAYESEELVWTAPLGASVSPSGETSWNSLAFELEDTDRALLSGARALRIAVRLVEQMIQPDAPTASGRLLVLPPVLQGAGFRAVLVEGNSTGPAGNAANVVDDVDATLAVQFASDISRLHPDGEDQRVLVLEWDDLSGIPHAAVGVDGYPAPFPLWTYRKLSFFLRGPQSVSDPGTLAASRVRLVVAEDSGAARFLDVDMPASAFTPGSWSKVVIDYGSDDAGVSVDGTPAADASVVYRPGLVRSFREEAGANGEEGGPRYVAVLLEPPSGSALPEGNFAVDEICLMEPKAAFGVYASGAGAWTKKGPLWTIGRTSVLSDLSLESRTEASAAGNPFAEADDTTDSGSARASGKAALTVLGARVSVEASAANVQGTYSWTGGHGFSVPLGPLTVSDSFSDDPESQELSREVALSLSGPLSLETSGALELLPTKTTRTWTAEAKAAAGQKAASSASFSAAYVGEAEDTLFRQPYQEAWAHALSRLAPENGSGERRRDFDAAADFELSGKLIGIAGSAAAGSAFNASLDTRTSDAQLKMAFPMEAVKTSATLAFTRSYTATESAADSPEGDGDSFDDAAAYSRVMEASIPLWRALPGKTLADSGLADIFIESSADTLNAAFADRIELSLKPPRPSGWAELVSPALADLSVARSFERTLDANVDALDTSAKLQFSAMNLFGAFGSTPIFEFYKSDEFAHSLEASASFPKKEEAEWQVGARQSLSFYGFTDSLLMLANSTRTGTDGFAQGSSLSWTLPLKKSLMKSMFRSILGKAADWEHGPLLAEFAASEPSTEIRETASLSIAAAEDVSWSWGAKHESILRAAKKLTWIAFAALSASGGTSDGDPLDTDIGLTIGVSLDVKF